jgi:hypothetical protein
MIKAYPSDCMATGTGYNTYDVTDCHYFRAISFCKKKIIIIFIFTASRKNLFAVRLLCISLPGVTD